MGRHRKKWVDEPEDRAWPFQISIDLARHKPKIAFMSGSIREYYPEDPGYSKFGTTYCLPDSEDTAKCTFTPSTNLLQKPISKVGYGIGGLLAPRFSVKPVRSQTPAPNAYPPVVLQPSKQRKKEKRSKKSKHKKWQEFVEMYEKIVQEQCITYEKSGLLTLPKSHHHHERQSTPKPDQLKKKKSMHKKHAHAKKSEASQSHKDPGHGASAGAASSHACHKKVAAFGMGLKATRFQLEKENKDKLGPALYYAELPIHKSFQITTPRGELIPRVRTVCNPTGYDSCMNCGINLINSDYYQTRNKMKVFSRDSMQDAKFKMINLSLCRECYCEGLKDGLEEFDKTRLSRIFIKARHCNSVHDHQEGLTEYLSKATCKAMLNMSRKELIYSRYFKDEPCQVGLAKDYKTI